MGSEVTVSPIGFFVRQVTNSNLPLLASYVTLVPSSESKFNTTLRHAINGQKGL